MRSLHHERQPPLLLALRAFGIFLLWLLLLGLTGWAAAALYVDLPVAGARLPAAILYLALVVAVLIFLPGHRRKAVVCLIGLAAVLGWWLTLSPSNDRDWQPDVARTAWAEIDGDRVTINNLRNAEYRTETDYTARWESRSYDLAQLRGIDLFVTFWGSPWIAHPIMSFDFGGGEHVAISVETRKEVGEEYSAFRGFFRQYELVYVVADERDLIRLRTTFRTGEEVYLYRTFADPAAAKAMFLDYLASLNALHAKPAFYNAITSNCTTNIRIHANAADRPPWDWRLLLNGKGDAFAYEYGRIERAGLSFEELKRRAHINDVARSVPASDDFSAAIRQGRPGFAPE